MEENLQLSQEQFHKLRQKELELLTSFTDVCRQLNLRYFVVEGTLLGAVRHSGFIPWDDDIDVGMLREDYDRFLKEAPTLLPDGLFLQTHKSDPAYPHCFAKLRNSRTAFVETTCCKLPINHGIYIDIFPFDDYPKSWLRGKLFDFQKLLIRYRIREVFYVPADRKLSVSNILRKLLMFVAKCRYQTTEDAIRHRERLIRQWKPSALLINNGSPWNNRERMPCNIFAATTELSFEGLTVSAPAGYEDYLKHVYGDYLILPPESERVPHHYLFYLDFDKAYHPEGD